MLVYAEGSFHGFSFCLHVADRQIDDRDDDEDRSIVVDNSLLEGCLFCQIKVSLP